MNQGLLGVTCSIDLMKKNLMSSLHVLVARSFSRAPSKQYLIVKLTRQSLQNRDCIGWTSHPWMPSFGHHRDLLRLVTRISHPTG